MKPENLTQLQNDIKNFMYNKTWTTKKSRMNSEERYLKYDIRSLILLNWYSVCMLALSVVTVYKTNGNFDLYNLVLSILLLGVTLIVTLLKFKQTANEYKVSYTKIILIENRLEDLMYRLRDDIKIDNPYEVFFAIKNDYEEILKDTPNHKYIDYEKISIGNNKVYKKIIYYSKKILLDSIYIMTLLFPLILILFKLFN